jgi:hypothetical protein
MPMLHVVLEFSLIDKCPDFIVHIIVAALAFFYTLIEFLDAEVNLIIQN